MMWNLQMNVNVFVEMSFSQKYLYMALPIRALIEKHFVERERTDSSVKKKFREQQRWVEFDMKRLRKAEGYIGWNVMIITIKMRSMVRIF